MKSLKDSGGLLLLIFFCLSASWEPSTVRFREVNFQRLQIILTIVWFSLAGDLGAFGLLFPTR